jgi:phospholipase/carboxylesterase
MKQGKATKASLEHLVFYPDRSRINYPTIVALHGRGTDEYDLLPVVESLGIPDALLVAPRAPLLFNPGGFTGGYAWYEFGEEGIPNPTTLSESLEILRGFLGEVKEAYPVDSERVLLLGFSQGTVMAYAVALSELNLIRGIVALSGYVPHRSGLPLKLHDLNGLSVFISHGAWDEIIPVEFGRESAQLLKTAGADVLYREYQMGHEVREETLRDLAAWTREILQR